MTAFTSHGNNVLHCTMCMYKVQRGWGRAIEWTEHKLLKLINFNVLINTLALYPWPQWWQSATGCLRLPQLCHKMPRINVDRVNVRSEFKLLPICYAKHMPKVLCQKSTMSMYYTPQSMGGLWVCLLTLRWCHLMMYFRCPVSLKSLGIVVWCRLPRWHCMRSSAIIDKKVWILRFDNGIMDLLLIWFRSRFYQSNHFCACMACISQKRKKKNGRNHVGSVHGDKSGWGWLGKNLSAMPHLWRS